MKHVTDRTIINRLRSIETAERYLIARTRAELNQAVEGRSVEAFGYPAYKSALAVGVTFTLVWMLQYGTISNFLTATI